MTRPRDEAPSLSPPAEPEALAGFPASAAGPERVLYRVVRAAFGPWWFAARDAARPGRFDLPLPNGTCYLAGDPLSALLEVVGSDLVRGAVSTRFLAERRVCELRPPRRFTLADLTSRRARGFGVTAEIGTVVPYELPHAWAERLFAAGFRGLLCWLRHDPARGEGFALFGRAGERRSWPRGKARPVSAELVERLRRECGIEVLDVPRASELRLVEPP